MTSAILLAMAFSCVRKSAMGEENGPGTPTAASLSGSMVEVGLDSPKAPIAEAQPEPSVTASVVGPAPVVAPEPGRSQGRDLATPATEVEMAEPDSSGTPWHGKVFPHFRLAGFYDDNIFIQHDHRIGDFVTIASVGLRIGWGAVPNPLTLLRLDRGVPLYYEDPNLAKGSFLMADYTGSAVVYGKTRSQDAFDQDAIIRAGWTDTKLTLGAFVRFQELTSSEIDIGGTVRQQILTFGANARYNLTGKSSLEISISDNTTHYSHITTSSEWVNENWYNYQISPKINLGPGLVLGLIKIQDHQIEYYERLLFRSTYQVTGKVSLYGRVGVEFREGNGSVTSPVVNLGVSYQPFDGTTIDLNAFREERPSRLIAGENYKRTGAELKVQQRFLQKFHLTAIAGFERLNYIEPVNSLSSNRNDNYFYGKLGLAFDITRWSTAQVFYNYQQNASTSTFSSFSDNQVGFEIDVAF